ncbi:MAG: GMP synthase (glutamine-hydrolyzing) [Myxococcota bacterium]
MSHPVLIVRTGAPIASLGTPTDYDPWFAGRMAAFDVDVHAWDAQRGAPAPEHLDWAAVLITGSAASVHDREEWSERAGAWCVRALNAGVPILGVCYGHQLLAHALGGRSGPNPNGPEYGMGLVEVLVDDPLFDADRFQSYQLHFDVVREVPDGARVLARSQTTDVQAMAIGDRCRTVQWHPEFDAAYVRGAIERRRSLLEPYGDDFVDRNVASIVELPDGGGAIARFLEHIAGVPRTTAP